MLCLQNVKQNLNSNERYLVFH
uniref:Uncharacterized protein n=1 Tax=Arundo donax TaxID=35708 RepID=A0A0A8XXU7_ARUDO